MLYSKSKKDQEYLDLLDKDMNLDLEKEIDKEKETMLQIEVSGTNILDKGTWYENLPSTK